MSLTEFLLARISEDEAVVRGLPPDPIFADDMSWQSCDEQWEHIALAPKRALAECDAKRRIVEHCRDAQEAAATILSIDWPAGQELREARERSGYSQVAHATMAILYLLALPYVNHPDYKPEWGI